MKTQEIRRNQDGSYELILRVPTKIIEESIKNEDGGDSGLRIQAVDEWLEFVIPLGVPVAKDRKKGDKPRLEKGDRA